MPHELRCFTFEIERDDGRTPFTCVASSLPEAREIARIAGRAQQQRLVEERSLEGLERDDVARELFDADPLFGEDWWDVFDDIWNELCQLQFHERRTAHFEPERWVPTREVSRLGHTRCRCAWSDHDHERDWDTDSATVLVEPAATVHVQLGVDGSWEQLILVNLAISDVADRVGDLEARGWRRDERHDHPGAVALTLVEPAATSIVALTHRILALLAFVFDHTIEDDLRCRTTDAPPRWAELS